MDRNTHPHTPNGIGKRDGDRNKGRTREQLKEPGNLRSGNRGVAPTLVTSNREVRRKTREEITPAGDQQ